MTRMLKLCGFVLHYHTCGSGPNSTTLYTKSLQTIYHTNPWHDHLVKNVSKRNFEFCVCVCEREKRDACETKNKLCTYIGREWGNEMRIGWHSKDTFFRNNDEWGWMCADHTFDYITFPKTPVSSKAILNAVVFDSMFSVVLYVMMKMMIMCFDFFRLETDCVS